MGLLRLKSYFIDTILPHWLETAFDQRSQQFVEGLELDGTPDRSGIVRVRTAARQIYVFAHAHALGVAPAGAIAKAEIAFENLRKTAWSNDHPGGYASTMNIQSGAIINCRRDLYDHACVLLALSALSKATGKPCYRIAIDEVIEVLDTTLNGQFSGYAEDDIGTLPRRQNPHMHLFEAFLSLWEALPECRYAARAGELYLLFQARFFDEKSGLLREFFGPGWEVSGDFGSDRHSPGHMSEWIWLLARYECLTGRDLSQEKHKLYANALLGKTSSRPFLVDEIDPTGALLTKQRRLWPQAEFLKANLSVNDANRETAEQIAQALLDSYLADTPIGTWRDCFDLDGRPTARTIPGSSLYHLWTAVAEFLERDTLLVRPAQLA
jgi:mannose/cellobiose epimerase-like protein (N-acyl-D-glucosamine 2-epimerase family)